MAKNYIDFEDLEEDSHKLIEFLEEDLELEDEYSVHLLLQHVLDLMETESQETAKMEVVDYIQ
jgi:hypothetical protein